MIGVLFLVGCSNFWERETRARIQEQSGRRTTMGNKTMLAFVFSVDEHSEKSRVQINLDRICKLWVVGPNTEAKLEKLKSSMNAHKLVAVEFDDSSKKILAVFPPKTEQILSLSEPTEAQEVVRVQTLMNPSLFVLRKDHPRFREFYELLKKAQKEGRQTALAIFPGDDKIEDVLLLESPKK
jgi:hypothetical protein